MLKKRYDVYGLKLLKVCLTNFNVMQFGFG